MRGLVVFLAVVSVVLGKTALLAMWDSWLERHQKTYSESEASTRKIIWMKNAQRILHLNSKNYSFVMQLNQFADLSDEEFYSNFLSPLETYYVGKEGAELHINSNQSSYPLSMDWRERGLVTDVKDQGKCKSSWAFSAMGALEGQNFKKSGHLLDLSIQQAIDCSWRNGNRGCHGGLAMNVFDYVNQAHGVCASSSYTYIGYMWHCMESYCKRVGYCSGYRIVQSGSETDLLDALYTMGPISVSVDASSYSFKYYHGGIYVDDDCSDKKLNHAMLLVGYGSNSGQDYWILKNSWGISWGNQGFMRLARNKNNMCGISTAATYPTVA